MNSGKIAVGAATTSIAEPVLWAAHQGGLGVIVGFGIGLISYLAAGEIQDLRERFAGAEAQSADRPRRDRAGKQSGRAGGLAQKGRSLGYRLLVGRSVRDEQPGPEPEEEDEDTVYLEEEAMRDEELLARGLLPLGWDLHPHVNTFFSKRTSILGMSGAGKSNLLARLVECLGKYDAPLVLCDSKPEYKRLCNKQYLRNAFRANAQNLTPENARASAAAIMERRLHVVVDLTSYETQALAATVMIELILGLGAYQSAQLEAGAALIPCTLILEEAADWLPEDESQSAIRGVKATRGQQGNLLAYLQRVWFNVATKGRSYGLGLITATQRPAQVDTRLIAQAEWRFLLKAMEPTDLKVYRHYGTKDEQIMTLDPNQGGAYCIGPDGTRGIYSIRRRESPDEAPSPGLENLSRRASATSSSAGVSGRETFRTDHQFERGNAAADRFQGNAETPTSRLDERFSGVSTDAERFQPDGNARPGAMETVGEDEGEDAGAGFTHAEMAEVLQAYRELLVEAQGGKVSRRSIQRRLNWSGRKYMRVIRPVCDAAGIALGDE